MLPPQELVEERRRLKLDFLNEGNDERKVKRSINTGTKAEK